MLFKHFKNNYFNYFKMKKYFLKYQKKITCAKEQNGDKQSNENRLTGMRRPQMPTGSYLVQQKKSPSNKK